ncbi:MAG: ABC transporter ATP-binding protein [Clostridium sp.]|nr:ABC transporter ATP-binding protein [Clostridium sp.]
MGKINLSGVYRQYNKGENIIYALNDVSLNIQGGEYVAIIGPSGSGKTTLLNIIGGIDKATKGEIIVNDTSITKLSSDKLAIFRRRNIGIVYQSYNLLPVLTARENILMPTWLDGKGLDMEYFNEIINTLGIKDRLEHYPSQLSGGQQQRVSIARALINKPSIILADEPTGNLDSENSKEIIELLRYSAKKFRQTLIIITHDLEVAGKADRIIKIKDGKIILGGDNV